MDGLINLREITALENQMVSNGTYLLATDPTMIYSAPKIKSEVPFLDFSPLQNAIKKLENASLGLNERINNIKPNQLLNGQLAQAEQQLVLANGLPRRPWFRHSIYAPGFYTGYGVKTLPGIREAIEQQDWKEMAEQTIALSFSINKLAKYLDQLAK